MADQTTDFSWAQEKRNLIKRAAELQRRHQNRDKILVAEIIERGNKYSDTILADEIIFGEVF